MSKKEFSIEEAKAAGEAIGIKWEEADFNPEQFAAGMKVEMEHGSRDPETDVTGDDPLVTAKIAWAHLKEFGDYYDRLEKMEKEAEGKV